jgi:drug/metabolite transporter (DMT)-like permease
VNSEDDTNAHDRQTLRGIALILAAVFMFSSMDALAKFMLKADYPLGGLIWARYVVNLLVMLALLWPRMGGRLFRTTRPGLQLVRGLLLVASTLCFYLALRYLPLAEAAAISFVGPVLTTILAGWLLHERASATQWLAVLLGFAGVLIIIRPGGSLFTPAALYPLLTAVLFSFYQIVTRVMSGNEHHYTTLFYTALIGGIITSIALPFSWQTPTLLQAAIMFGMGVFGGYGHYLLIRAVAYASPAALAPFGYSQLVWSTVLGYAVFRDFPDGGSLLGMAIVVSAGLLALNWKHMRRLPDDSSENSAN